MQNIRIKEGTYKIRGKDVELAGMVFPFVEGFKVGAKGGYVTVDGKAVAGFPDRNIKIACDGEHAYEMVSGSVKVTKREETLGHVLCHSIIRITFINPISHT